MHGLSARLVEHALAQQIELPAPVHRALDELEFVYPSFGLSLAVGQGHRGYHGFRGSCNSSTAKAFISAMPDAFARSVHASNRLCAYSAFLWYSSLSIAANSSNRVQHRSVIRWTVFNLWG